MLFGFLGSGPSTIGKGLFSESLPKLQGWPAEVPYAFSDDRLEEIVHQVFRSECQKGRKFPSLKESDLLLVLPKKATFDQLAKFIDSWIEANSIPPHPKFFRPELTRWFGYGRA